MKKKLLFIAPFLMVFFGILFSTEASLAATYYVSPGTDTIQPVRDMIRTVNGNMTEDITVYLRGGTYWMTGTLSFDQRDSGTNGYNIIYKSYPGERAEISGGQSIASWTDVGNGIYKASMASFPAGSLPIRQLFVNGQRAIRARTPNIDPSARTPDVGPYFRIENWEQANKRLKIKTADSPNSNNLANIEILVQRGWRMDILKISSYAPIDANYAYVYFQEPAAAMFFNDPSWLFEQSSSYHYENNYDFLDSAGEWFYNSGAKEVFYKPVNGENMATAEVIAPVVETLVSVEGSINSFAHNIQFVNLIFEYGTWLYPNTDGYCDHQTGEYKPLRGEENNVIPATIKIQYADNITLRKNLIRHTGNTGIAFQTGTRDNTIIGNVLNDIGGNGIAVDNARANSPAMATENESILNNYVSRVGQNFYDSAGILSGYVNGVKIEHNEIFDCPYSGISEGWGWGYGNNNASNISIRYNRIYNVMNLVVDGAGIYTLGTHSTSYQTGAFLEQNYIYNINASPWVSWTASWKGPVAGIYLDQASDYMTIKNNVFENVEKNKNENVVGSNTQWIPWPDSNVTDSDIKAAAGIEAAYADIRDGDPLGDDITPPIIAQTPYGGAAWPIPGTIEAENYDTGGEGTAYHDTTAGNSGGQYRSDGADIWGPLDNSYIIGDTKAGEWLEYTVNVASGGTYTVEARVSSMDSYGKFHIEIDGADVTGQLAMPAYAGSLAWSTISKSGVSLTAGQHIMRVSLDNNGNGNLEAANLNWVRFQLAQAGDAPAAPQGLSVE